MFFAYLLVAILVLAAVIMITWIILRAVAGIICAINTRLFGTWYGKMPFWLMNIVDFFAL